jgi:putative aldouronate transport system substrate-binding protein
MRQNWKKLVAAMLAAVMMLAAATTALAWEPQWAHDEDLSDYKLCENPGDITLRMAVTDHATISSWDDNEFIKWLEEVTNVNFEFELIPYESRAEKLGLLLNSGDYPDIFLSCGMTDAMVSRFGVDEGMFLVLNDYIDQYGNFVNRIFDTYSGSKGLITQLDGNIYSLPVVNECYHCTIPTKFWINQTWLDNLNLEMPTTLDELYNVLVAFRDQDANGNGDPTDEIPLAGDYADGWYTNPEMFVMNAFTYYNLDLDKTSTSSAEAFGMYLDGDTVVTPFALDEFKQGVEYMAKLVSEGLIYEGSFTQDLAGLTNICESGRLGASSGGYILFANLGSEIYQQYRACTPVTGPNGNASIVSFPYDSVGGNSFVISADTEYPVEAFRVGDLFYSYAATMRSYYGVYGEQWTDADADAVGINGEPAMFKLLTPWQESEPQQYCILQMCPSFRDATFRLGEPSDPDVDLYSGDGLETLLYQVTHEYEEYTTDEKTIPPLKFTDDENADMAVIKANLSNTIKEGMFAFFTGTKTVENDYDAWLADLEAQGLSTLVGYYQAAYDAQYK